MKTGKRIAAVILSVVLILTSFPVTVLAAESGDFTYEVYDGKAEITGYTGSASELVISDTLNGYPVESIGYEAFRDCDHLTTVTIPDSVESIGGYAFYYCTSLTTVEIPDSVESIGNSAFDNCDSLESIQVDENNPNYSSDASGVLFDKNKTTLLQYPIGNARTSYTIPDSVESIGDKAFYHCDMTTVEIGDSVTSIGKQAFAECDSLTTVTIPDSVTSIGDYAFRYCDSLKSIQVSENNPNYSSDASGVLFDKSKSTLIQYPIGNARTSYTLLDNVGSISEYAFAWCDSLTTVEIGDSVESIGRYAFSSCDSLTTVTIPDSVTSIGDDAFFSCDSLTTVEIGNSVNSIGEEAFVMCFGLTMVEIGNSVISIGSWAFSSCFSLTTVEIPGSVESIGEGAFRFCDSLKSIQVDENNPNYSSDASGVLFDKSQTTLIQYPIGNACTSYSIPESVESIGEYAFAPCNSLTTVEIGDSVESIGTRAFSGCGSLTTVYYAGTQEEWEQIAIESGNEDLLKAKLIFQYDPENPCVSGRHTEEVLPGKAATCTEAGLTEGIKCSVCGEILTAQEEIPALGHSFGSWQLTTAPTYVLEGVETATCSRCGEIMTRPVARLIPPQVETDEETGIGVRFEDDTYEGDMVVEAKQEFDGQSFQILNNERGNFKNVLYDVTTKVNGEKVQPAGKVLVSIPLPEGYNPERTVVYYVPNDGSGIQKLDSYYADGYVYFETDHFSSYALVDETECAHTNQETIPSKAATCTESGWTDGVKCADCGYILKAQEEIPAKGHSFGEWTVIREATVEQTGLRERTCSVCGAKEQEEIPALALLTGDVNGDGKVNSSDARLALRAAVGLEDLTEEQKAAADVNRDGNVRSSDARKILRVAVGLDQF